MFLCDQHPCGKIAPQREREDIISKRGRNDCRRTKNNGTKTHLNNVAGWGRAFYEIEMYNSHAIQSSHPSETNGDECGKREL